MFAEGRLIPFLSSDPEVTKLTVAVSFVCFLTTNWIFILNAILLYLVLKLNLNQLENFFSYEMYKYVNKIFPVEETQFYQSNTININRPHQNLNYKTLHVLDCDFEKGLSRLPNCRQCSLLLLLVQLPG